MERVAAVRKANPDATLVVFVTAGRALHVPKEIEEAADALFWTAHTGSFAGDAIADILAGIAEPTGRLSHGLPFADGITSGFDTRAARTDRRKLTALSPLQVRYSCTVSPLPSAASPWCCTNGCCSPETITSGAQHCVTGMSASNTRVRVACKSRADLSARSR